MTRPFDYPRASADRRHGPVGYSDYSHYRPWLRDEFTFRCVYCLAREQWGRVVGDFDVDHFVPQVANSELAREYANLVYSCRTCNLLKGAQTVPNPRDVFTAEQVQVLDDGTIVGRTDDAKRLLLMLGLHSPRSNEWRLLWIGNVELAAACDHVQFRRLMEFPNDLPNLGRLRPPGGNCRPDGIKESYFAARERGELADTY
jgi:hypothetical protein